MRLEGKIILLRNQVAEIGQREQQHADRIKAGIVRARAKGKAIGRPSALTVEKEKIAREMLALGAGLNKVARAVGVGAGTVARIKAEMFGPQKMAEHLVEIYRRRESNRVEKINAGLARARAKGKAIGRPSALTVEKEKIAREMLALGAGLNKVARAVGVGAGTVARIKAEIGLSLPAVVIELNKLRQEIAETQMAKRIRRERTEADREKARQYRREWSRRRADKAMLYDMEREP